MTAFLTLLITFLSSGELQEINAEASIQEKMTTFYFIRHAEKDERDPGNKDPKLSPAGQERAQKWAEVLKEVEFDMIFSTNYERTRSTASVIAAAQEKEVEFYDPRKLFDPEFQQKTNGKTVLVVGHSNTNPAFVNAVLSSEKYQALDETEYGSLFIVTVAPNGEKTSQLLYIN